MTARKPYWPLATAALIAANLAVACITTDAGCERYGLVPAHITALTLVTSTFLHDPSNWSHITGNLFMLAIVGWLVERVIGPVRFCAIYFAAGLGGSLLHTLANPSSTEPLVGASTSICGLLPATVAIRPQLGWSVAAMLAIDVFHVCTGTSGTVSCAGHLGGFAVGTLAVAVASIRYPLPWSHLPCRRS